MRLPLAAALTALSLTTLAPLSAAGGSSWEHDLGPALEKAQEQGKDVLVDFTGSDWCKYCIQLNKEVWSKPEFDAYATEQFILVELDFPSAGGKVYKAMSDEQRARNQQWHDWYGVKQKFPSVFLLTPEGVAYARTGYQPGGAEDYNRHLEEIRDGDERARVAVMLRRFEADPDNEAGDRLSVAYQLFFRTGGAFRETLLETIRRHDPEDSKLLLAGAAMDGFMAEHFKVQSPDWPVVKTAALALAKDQPSVERMPRFQMYLALAYAHTGEAEASAAAVARAEELGMSAGMKAWLNARLAEAERASAQ